MLASVTDDYWQLRVEHQRPDDIILQMLELNPKMFSCVFEPCALATTEMMFHTSVLESLLFTASFVPQDQAVHPGQRFQLLDAALSWHCGRGDNSLWTSSRCSQRGRVDEV